MSEFDVPVTSPRIDLKPLVPIGVGVMVLVLVFVISQELAKLRTRLTIVETDQTHTFNAIHTLEKRMANDDSDTEPENGTGFSSDACSVDCREGHTYKSGCVFSPVKPDGSQEAV